ncbi:hypothetical protein [Propionivibrio dicarboxylicus]|uniref:hypothetical protein n=1 Tax=Propionivibrio dicarboxylicus TaxID=83767 RepID=UPI00115FA30C|nr:hypothetical protein [Propionivibrio dicarboxylicus]
MPLFEPSAPFEMLCPKSLGIANELVIDDDRFGSDVDGAALAEYSQLFGLYDMLCAGDVVADDLFLFQYRKFISPVIGGGLESVSPWVRVLTPEMAPPLFPGLEQLAALKSRLSVGSVFDFGESLSANYARVHVVDDFVMFVAACAESSQMSSADVKSFATIRGIIPSPALCYIEVDLFIRIMRILKDVWEHYSAHYQLARSGYQRRVSGYLLERLHSYLLCKWLLDNTEPDIKVWQRYVITDSLAVSAPGTVKGNEELK